MTVLLTPTRRTTRGCVLELLTEDQSEFSRYSWAEETGQVNWTEVWLSDRVREVEKGADVNAAPSLQPGVLSYPLGGLGSCPPVESRRRIVPRRL